MLKAKEREVECLSKELTEKGDLLKTCSCQLDALKKDMKNKCKKYRELIKQLKSGVSSRVRESNAEDENCEDIDVEELLRSFASEVEVERNSLLRNYQNVERQLKAMASEKKTYMKEKNEAAGQLERLRRENEILRKEADCQKNLESERDELLKNVEELTNEKKELSEKVRSLLDNIHDLDSNFKETRWALTAEVAEKHDQVQELRRCIGVLEEQLRQADMQTHFKDDIIKELRKDLRASQKTERRGLYDVVAEVRARKQLKNEKANFDCEEKEEIYGSPRSANEGQDNKEGKSEVAMYQSQLECLKKSLKARMEQLKEQEEFTRDLEEELSKTKVEVMLLQEKYEKQDRRSWALAASVSEPTLNWHFATLSCAVTKIEETLKNLAGKHSCGISTCKGIIEEEIKKIRSVKDNLKTIEKQSKSVTFDYNPLSKDSEESDPRSNRICKSQFQRNKCNLVHIEDVETFQEKAASGMATLEQMKEQISLLEKLIKKYTDKFPCKYDKVEVESCEERLEKLREEFDEVTSDMCDMLAQLKPQEGSCELSESFDDSYKSKDDSISFEEVSRLRSEYQKLQEDICVQENAAEKLKRLVKQFENELECKRHQLAEQSKEMKERCCEILNVKDLVRGVCRRLRDIQNRSLGGSVQRPFSPSSVTPANLSGLFTDLNELSELLENSMNYHLGAPMKLIEDNDKLREKLGCLEKCVYNKDETLRVLQDTVKLRESQIEELKCKMEFSETQSSRLAQDMEEKCRLIANLQEAVRKCKQFEMKAKIHQVESLQFELCDLDHRLKKYEKEVVIKDKKIERLHSEITDLSTKNCSLTEKLKILEPKFKTLYKTCQLFEKMVNDLQEELDSRECDIENLCGKIKDLECELEVGFKKCEDRAAEDSKCIDELSLSLKNFQSEFCCARDNYNMTINEVEETLHKERELSELREKELQRTICHLQNEISALRNEQLEKDIDGSASSKIADLECIIREAECRQESSERKIMELERVLECSAIEREEERKSFLQKLCEEKNENMKNKCLITKLNENMKMKMMKERSFKENIERFTEENNSLKEENVELKTELEVRKKVMSAMERDDEQTLDDMEQIICQLKIQKADLKNRLYNVQAELDKETKLKDLFQCQVDELNLMLESKLDEFNSMVENYKDTNSRIRQTLLRMKEVEENLSSIEGDTREKLNFSRELNETEYLKNLLDMRSSENGRLMGQVEILKVELESMKTEKTVSQAKKDSIISNLQHELSCLDRELQDLEKRYEKLAEENKALQSELERHTNRETTLQTEFREKQKELCNRLNTTMAEKNDLLNSLDELQRQLEDICLENVNKEKMNRELSQECSRLKKNNDMSYNEENNNSDEVICSLSGEVENLNCELSSMREDYSALNREYEAALEQIKCSEKKKSNLEKLYMELNNDNKDLQELRLKYERELCELKTQNLLLKDMMANKGESGKNVEDKRKLWEKIKELTMKIKTLEKRVIPELEQEIAEKNFCIENLKIELREANISSQRMRNEALRVIQHTKKYLAAQRCANDNLKSRLESSNKRGNMLGAENRELEDQLKAVTRMNEFLLCQLENAKKDVGEIEPRSFSPLPWGCSTVERDTSSSEYMAESGIQSMQPSPTNMDYTYDKYDSKRGSPQWNSLKKNKCGGSMEYSMSRSGVR